VKLSLERDIAVAKSSGYDAARRTSFPPGKPLRDVPFRSPENFSLVRAGTNKNKIVFGNGLEISHSNALTGRGEFGTK
jgi:hypothetical protein